MLQPNQDEKLSQTVLEFLTHGVYPESEAVAAEKFPTSAPPVALQHISKAREEAEVFTPTPYDRCGFGINKISTERIM